MVWTLDMDDFNGQFCRRNKKEALNRFPLVSAIKEELEEEETTTSSSTLSMTSSLNHSNETNRDDDQFEIPLDELFHRNSTSTLESNFFFNNFILFFLTSSYLIGSSLNVVA